MAAISAELKCSGVETVVNTLLFQELFMGTAFNNLSMVKHHDRIAVAYRGETVGNDEYGPAFHQAVHACLNQAFRMGIYRTGCFIHDKHRRIGNCCPGDGKKLSLSLGKPLTIILHHRVITILHHHNEVVGTSKLCGLDDLILGGIKLTEPDIIPDGSGKEMGILKNNTKRVS